MSRVPEKFLKVAQFFPDLPFRFAFQLQTSLKLSEFIKDGASSRPVLRISGFLRKFLLRQRYFCTVFDYVEKADLSKGYQNPKKLGATAQFSEIIEL